MERRFKRLVRFLGLAVGTTFTGCTQNTTDPSSVQRDVAGGAVHVRVVTHAAATPVESVACWTYVTDGLMAVGQKELTITVAREPGETSPPVDPFKFLDTVYGLAKQGRIVDVGDVSKFVAGGFLGRRDFQGVIYVPAQPWIGVTYPAPTLHALVVTGDEVDAAIQYGVLRILGELGLAHRAFPTAVWVDRKRAPLRTPE